MCNGNLDILQLTSTWIYHSHVLLELVSQGWLSAVSEIQIVSLLSV